MLKKLSIALVAIAICSAMAPALAANYLGNSKSMKFHYSDCRTIKNPSASHFISLGSRDEAVAAGYVPCGVCKP